MMDGFSDSIGSASSGSDDTLTGGSGADRLIGLGGNDSLNGGAGDDVLYGDARLQIGSFGLLYGNSGGAINNYNKADLTAAAHDLLIINHAQAINGAYGHRNESPWLSSDIQSIETTGSKLLIGYLSVAKITNYMDTFDPNSVDGSGNPKPSSTWLSARDSSDIHNETYLGKVTDPEWQTLLHQRVDELMAQGFNGLFLDDIMEYRNQVVHHEPATDEEVVALAPSAQAMRDVIVELRQYVDGKLAAEGKSPQDFLFIANNGIDLIQDAAHFDPSGQAAANGRYYNALDAFLAENYFSKSNSYAYNNAVSEYGGQGIPLLSLDNYVFSDGQADTFAQQAINLGYLPYEARHEIYLGELYAPYVVTPPAGGNDHLDGGFGADVMYGGGGDDVYLVDNVGDLAVERAGEGTDIIFSSVSYDLGDNVEKLTLSVGALRGNGNNLDNLITGDNRDNTLSGRDGNDTLNGGNGNDTMKGGLGDDTYVVNAAGDVVTEYTGQGNDTVKSSVSYVLGANLENLVLSGIGNIAATGNTLANHLTGTSGNNLLDGKVGADVMAGGGGNDTYVVDNAGDAVVEVSGGGTDLVNASVTFSLAGQFIENLTLTGTNAINGTGNSLANTITGNSAANIINGGTGGDMLWGKGGADVFLFGTSSGADTISDFSASQNDTINVNAYTHGTAHTAYITQNGSDVLISLGGSNVITVQNATSTDAAFLSHIVW